MNNSATNFADAVAENLQQVFLGQGHFEEQLLYTPVGGVPRQIAGQVSDVEMVIEEHAHHETETWELKALVIDDPVLGVAVPQLQDQIVRLNDPAAAKWDLYRIVDHCLGGYILKFRSVQLKSAGNKRGTTL